MRGRREDLSKEDTEIGVEEELVSWGIIITIPSVTSSAAGVFFLSMGCQIRGLGVGFGIAWMKICAIVSSLSGTGGGVCCVLCLQPSCFGWGGFDTGGWVSS